MELINIIAHDSDTGIISIDTFAVVEEQLKDDVVEEAENFFKDKCIGLAYPNPEASPEEVDEFREDLDEALNDGFVEIGETTISFVWSYPENI